MGQSKWRSPRQALAGAAALVFVIAAVLGAGLLLVNGDGGVESGTVREGPEPNDKSPATSTTTIDYSAFFTWPDDCTHAAIGAEEIVGPDLLVGVPPPSWADSGQGRWLRDRLGDAGFPNVYGVGSAFVVMHGADAVALAWFGPPGDTAGLPLVPVERVESADLGRSVPFEVDPYRPAVVDSVVAGGVRLWLLTHPRGGYEVWNFPGLTTGPCLPDQSELRQVVRRVGDAADQQPYVGALPLTAGRFSINADVGMSITDSGDQHLVQVAERVLGRPVTFTGTSAPSLDGQDIFVFTGIPPQETNANTLAGIRTNSPPFLTPRTSAGGLDVLVGRLGGAPLDEVSVNETARIAEELNRDPFLGQPSP